MAISDGYNKLVAGGIVVLMMAQNWGFFKMYLDLWLQTAAGTEGSTKCSTTSFWLGYDAFICWLETVMACGMMLGAWFDGSKTLFWIFFVLHLIGGVAGYTVAVFGLGAAVHGEDFAKCAEGNQFDLSHVKSVWNLQAVFYIPYCFCMAGLFYQGGIVMQVDPARVITKDDKKLFIAGLGLLMAIQNFGFFEAYAGVWGLLDSRIEVCSSLTTWVVVSAFACYAETVMALGMMFGAWIDGTRAIWWIFFVLHLVIALGGYTGGVIGVGRAVYSDDGYKCALKLAPKEPTDDLVFMDNKPFAIFWAQAVFYPFYCVCMVGLLYQVVIGMSAQEGRQPLAAE